MYPAAELDSDSNSPSSVAERARVVKGGIEGVLSKKSIDNEAVIHRKDSTSARDSDSEVPNVITETEPWIESDEQNVDDEGLVVADLIAVGVISRPDAGAADSDYDNDIDLSDVPCAAAVEYINVAGSTSASPSAIATATAGDACGGSSINEFRHVDCHAYQDVEEGDVVVEAEAIEVEVDVEVEVEVEGMCVGTLLALDDDSTLEVEEAESSCILEALTVHTGPLGSGQGCPYDPDTGVEAVVAAAEHGSSLNDDVMLSSNSGGLDNVQCHRKGGEGGGGEREGEGKGEKKGQSVEESSSHWPAEFVMSWNRRIAESAIFFDLMLKAGFSCEHKGKCVYSFTVNTAHRL